MHNDIPLHWILLGHPAIFGLVPGWVLITLYTTAYHALYGPRYWGSVQGVWLLTSWVIGLVIELYLIAWLF